MRKRRPKAFPLRGRWIGEAKTDEVEKESDLSLCPERMCGGDLESSISCI